MEQVGRVGKVPIMEEKPNSRLDVNYVGSEGQNSVQVKVAKSSQSPGENRA
jgi:hypothetical protein